VRFRRTNNSLAVLAGRGHKDDRAMFGCVELDGVAAYIDASAVAPELGSGGPVSWSMWVKRNGSPAGLEMVLGINTAAGGNAMLQRIAAGTTVVSFFAGSNVVTGTTHETTSCVDNEWRHHCITWDIGGTDRLLYYLDGVLQFTSDVLAAALATNDTWSIGMEYDGATPGDFFTGRVAQAAFFPYVLSAADAVRLCESPSPLTARALGARAIYLPGSVGDNLPAVFDLSGQAALDAVASGITSSDFSTDAPL